MVEALQRTEKMYKNKVKSVVPAAESYAWYGEGARTMLERNCGSFLIINIIIR
jgi:hypothetical protein